MLRKSFLIVLILAMLLSCQIFSGQPSTPEAAPRDKTDTPVTPTSKSGPAATPTPLTASLSPGVDLNQMAPNTPLTVEFNQPVDIDSAQIPLLSYPWLAGEMEWDDSRTRLTFTPETGLFPSERYILFVNDELKSDAGGTLETAPSWDIQMLPRPHVIRHQPGEVHLSTRLPTIQLEFSEQMDTESIISSLSVQPETPLSLTFEGNTAWITPQQPLLPGTRYHFTLAGSAKDLRGAVIGQDYRWDYNLPGLVLNVTDTGLTEPNDRLAVNFNYPLQQTDLSNLLSIRPAVDGRWSWRGDQQIVLQTAQPLDYSTEYTIEFPDELIDANQDPFPPPPPLTYSSPPPILGTFPNWAVLGDINDPVVITFTLPMDQASVEAAFRLEPAVDGSFSWIGNAMYFQPEGGLQPNTRYTAVLDTGALTLAGQAALLEPYTWSFEPIASYFYGVPTFGDYGPNAQVLDVDGRRAIQFYAPEDSAVLDFELYRLSLAQFLDRYASGFRGVAGFQRAPISTEGASFITTWSEMIRGKDGGYDGTSRETIVPEQVEAGLYLLNMTGEDDTFSQLILVLTRNTVMVKQAEGQIVSWVTDINGDPRPGVRVSIFARDGELISQGRADEHGVFSTGVDKDPQPLIVVAEDSLELTGREIEGTDITVSGLSDEWRTGGGWYGWWRPKPITHKYAAYIYTDRPIYKPGQDVFFKVVLRSDSDAQIDLLPEGTPATVRMRDVRNNIVQSLEMVTNEYGTLHGQFSLAVGAMLGDYQLDVSVDGEEFRQLFKVQDYRKPDYEITVSTDKPKYVAGDPIQVDVDASYFFGQPLSNASVTIKLYELVQYEMYGWIDDEKDTPEYIWIGGYDPNISGATDENGHFSDGSLVASLGSMGVPAPYEQNGVQSITWGIEATVDDGSHQTVSSFSVVEVYSAEESISLDVGNWLKTPGEPFELSGSITDLEGLPVSGRNMRLELLQYNPDTYNYDRLIDSMVLTSDGAGKVQIDYTIDRSGYYKMSLTGQDERGNGIGANAWLYAYSAQESWANQYIETLRIASDKGTYQPGDTARLVIESSFSGPALLAFERGLTRRILPVRLESPATLIEVPIQADDAPNIFVTVNAWQAQDTSLTETTYTNLNDSRLQTASTEIGVPVAGKTLSVAITPDRQSYAPNDQVTFTIQVSDEQGNPVQAELSAALVDEAIFSLSEELSGPIFDAFYAPRRHIVRTFDSMSLTRILMSGGMGGGGGGEGAANPRTDFPDTAAWFPVFYTDEQGSVTFTVNLPDTLTSWRMTVKAVTADSKVGQAQTNIITQKAIIVRPVLPRVLTAGDQGLLSSMVHNYSEDTLQLGVSLQISSDSGSPVEIIDASDQSITLNPGEVRLLGWSIQAIDPADALVTISAQPIGEDRPGDAVSLQLTIQPLAIPDIDNQIGDFTGALDAAVVIPEGVMDISTVRIELSRSIAGTLLTGLEYLTGYPYGCVEQTMSRALPNAVVARAFNQLGVSNATLEADLPPMINAGLQRLYGYQHNDGGWGWWFDDQTDAYQTAWVVFGLSVTAEAGYQVDLQVIQRGAEWLMGYLGGFDPDVVGAGSRLDLMLAGTQNQPVDMDLRTRAFALYSLAYAGYGDVDASLALADQIYELDTFSQAALALALHRIGEIDAANRILDVIAQSAAQRDGMVYWPNPNEDGHYYQKTMSSSVRSTAMALEAFLKIQPDRSLIPGTVRWLMSQRRQEGWGSTNETAYTIIALTDHLALEQTATFETSFEVLLNDAVIANGILGPGEPVVVQELPVTSLQTGGNLFQIRVSDDSRLYYVIQSRMFFPSDAIEPDGVATIQRRYLDPETDEALLSPMAGELVKVELQVSLPERGFFIILEDHLPGGLEALNESLNITSHEQTLYGEEPNYLWRDYGYNNKEVHADRVSFFVSEFDAGERTYSYLARATHSGIFTSLPAELYAMYDISLWGRSSSDTLEISP